MQVWVFWCDGHVGWGGCGAGFGGGGWGLSGGNGGGGGLVGLEVDEEE